MTITTNTTTIMTSSVGYGQQLLMGNRQQKLSTTTRGLVVACRAAEQRGLCVSEAHQAEKPPVPFKLQRTVVAHTLLRGQRGRVQRLSQASWSPRTGSIIRAGAQLL
jgi:hypothetical protein